jgi:hypothetical protein
MTPLSHITIFFLAKGDDHSEDGEDGPDKDAHKAVQGYDLEK